MRVVDVGPRVEPASEVDDLADGREIAVHREQAVADDQRATRLSPVPIEQRGQGAGVGVRIDVDGRAAQPAAVDERRVVQRVGENHVAARDERRNDADVRGIPARERERALRPEELGELALQRFVLGRVARDQTGRAGAYPVIPKRLSGRGHQAWVGRQAEVVVRREVDGGTAIGFDDGAAAPGRRSKGPLEVAVAQLRELGGENVVDGMVDRECGHDSG